MTSSCANCKFLFIYLKLFVVASTNFNRMEKEYGKLSLDQFQRLVETLPEVRSQMAELPSIIKSASREKLSEILDEDFSWSDIYELPFIHGIALLFLAMGRVQKLSEVAKSEDPQAALFDWMDTEELEDWNSGEGGLFQKKHIVGLTVVMQRNILSIMLYHRTLSTLVEAVRSGDDDSLFLAVRVDRSIVACPTFADRIARAEL